MTEEEKDKHVLDLSKKCLKKVPKQEDAQSVRTLILDDNELQKIDNIDSYLKIEKLSLSKNQLLRMYGVCRLHCLRELNLSFNGILTIEGLKELVHLTHLNLEGNNIKTIEHLNTNVNLEYLNLSENSIGSISDISFLKCLKELHLYGNRITHLKQCDKYLPTSLEVLTLAKNIISDLNEICTLSHLTRLHSITINENPCVQMTGGSDGFDHRPFVLNWCMSVKVIDGFVVDPIESLRAEWLYSQGKGRQFRVGEQAALAKYLSSACPLLGKPLENENERKLRLILSKAQQHQRQLQEEISESSNTSGNNSPSSVRKKVGSGSRIQSPRFARMSGRHGSPDSMSNSYHGNTSSSFVSNSNDMMSGANNHILQMTTSLIENIKNDSVMTQNVDGSTGSKPFSTSSHELTPRTTALSQYNDHSQNVQTGGPLAAASKMVPVPETLMSPDICPVLVAQRVSVPALNSQNNVINTKISRNRDKNGSPKVVRSPHFKRNNEKSPTLSPRKTNNQTQKSNISDNQSKQCNTATCIQDAAPKACGVVSSDDDSDSINVEKLKTIRNMAAQRNQHKRDNVDICADNINNSTECCAILIQKIWRGYYTRKKTKWMAEKILRMRTQEYIEKLTKDMEMTKAQLENERKIQQLQMQAINALWKKVSSMQNSSSEGSSNQETCMNTSQDGSCQKTVSLDNNSATVVSDLAKTCSMLTNQVQQLQGSMRDILNCLAMFVNLPHNSFKKANFMEDNKDSASTQTEITAVHTPQIENQTNFPFKIRPRSLPLETGEVTQKASNQIISEKNKDENLTSNKRNPNTEKVDDDKEQSEEQKLNSENLMHLK